MKGGSDVSMPPSNSCSNSVRPSNCKGGGQRFLESVSSDGSKFGGWWKVNAREMGEEGGACIPATTAAALYGSQLKGAGTGFAAHC
jgi:hypothetical protein